jgi:hypothetical protein
MEESNGRHIPSQTMTAEVEVPESVAEGAIVAMQ